MFSDYGVIISAVNKEPENCGGLTSTFSISYLTSGAGKRKLLNFLSSSLLLTFSIRSYNFISELFLIGSLFSRPTFNEAMVLLYVSEDF